MTESKNYILNYEPGSIYAKYALIDFFSKRSYKFLTSYQDIIEADFVNTMLTHEHMYRKKGRVIGLTLSFLFCDTLFKNFKTANKFLISYFLFKAGGELLVYKNLDELTIPFDYIYSKYYWFEEHDS